MSEHKTGSSWWQTMPGVLAGIAAVITALGGMIAVVYQSGLLSSEAPGVAPVSSGEANVDRLPENVPAEVPERPSPQPSEPGQVRVGHYAFKLLRTALDSYSTNASGDPQKLSLRLSIRVTDVMGMSDYVDGRTIRLLVDGAELSPVNSINFAVYARQSVETDALFIVPADASSIELLLGRPEEATGKLPLTLDLSAK